MDLETIMFCLQDSNGDVIGVAQVINKANEGYFTNNDERLFERYLQFCGIGLRNAQIYERSQLEVKRNQVLLDLAGVIFQEQSTLETTIHRILTPSRWRAGTSIECLVEAGDTAHKSLQYNVSMRTRSKDGRGTHTTRTIKTIGDAMMDGTIHIITTTHLTPTNPPTRAE